MARVDHDVVRETSSTIADDVVFDEPARMGEFKFACSVPGHSESGIVHPFEVFPAD